jgi:hypothetical protein
MSDEEARQTYRFLQFQLRVGVAENSRFYGEDVLAYIINGRVFNPKDVGVILSNNKVVGELSSVEINDQGIVVDATITDDETRKQIANSENVSFRFPGRSEFERQDGVE